MGGIRKPKTGRRDKGSRDEARRWVDLYRLAGEAPGGILCLNPDDPSEEQVHLDSNDPQHLLRMLKQFAEHGTFELVGEAAESIRLLPLRDAYRRAREAGQSHREIVERLGQEYHCDPRTIERKVAGCNRKDGKL